MIKKTAFGIFCFALLASPLAASASPSCVKLSFSGGVGMTDARTGNQVSALQQFLGISPATGYFGVKTKIALQKWQSSQGITTTGYVGPLTRGKMACGSSSSRGTTPTPTTPASTHADFGNPQRVTIQGYSRSAEEPWITADGQYLIFDSRTDPPNAADFPPKIYYAKRIDDTTFTFMGEVKGVNTPTILTQIAGVDDNNNFYFVSTRNMVAPDYNGNYRGIWHDGTVTNIVPLTQLGSKIPGVLKGIDNLSYDGNTLYLTTFMISGSVPSADNGIAVKNPDGSFTGELPDTDPRAITFKKEFASLYDNLPRGILIGAPMLSRDGLEVFVGRDNLSDRSAHIFVARRSSTAEPFGAPQQVTADDGFVERPFIYRDGTHLYYHKAIGNGQFWIYVLTRRE